jgi:hypothetical protein
MLNLCRFFSFLVFYTVGRTPWTEDQPVAKPLSANRTTQTQNKRTETFMPRVGFEPTIPALERAKTVHALHRAPTVIGIGKSLYLSSYWVWGSRCGRYEAYYIVWDITPCYLAVHRHFGETYCIHLQCRRVSKQVAKSRRQTACY